MNQDDPDGSAKRGNSDKQTDTKEEDLKEGTSQSKVSFPRIKPLFYDGL